MKAVRVFASAGMLSLACAGFAGGALAERNGSGPFFYQGSGTWPSADPQPSRGFFDLFLHRKPRASQPRPSDGLGRASRQPVDVELSPPVEKIVVYQPEKLVPLSTTAFTE